jgi:hypothetical protein
VPIVPDDKDWTWVLHKRCPECGFDAGSLPVDEVAPLVRACAVAWGGVLQRPGHEVSQRPQHDTWSPLEYACHVRDVFRLYRYRLRLMLSEENPTFPNWDQDETAEAERYADQDPMTVSSELQVAADALAHEFEGIGADRWQRAGVRSDGASFTVETFGRYMIHDPIHHLHDVGVAFAQPR